MSSPDIVGLGRISGVRFPRLGGVLHNRIQPGSAEARLLESAAARTIRAGYQTAMAMGQVARVSAIHSDADDLWEAFVPTSYRIPRRVAATAWEVCRFDDFWVDVLEELGLERRRGALRQRSGVGVEPIDPRTQHGRDDARAVRARRASRPPGDAAAARSRPPLRQGHASSAADGRRQLTPTSLEPDSGSQAHTVK